MKLPSFVKQFIAVLACSICLTCQASPYDGLFMRFPGGKGLNSEQFRQKHPRPDNSQRPESKIPRSDDQRGFPGSPFGDRQSEFAKSTFDRQYGREGMQNREEPPGSEQKNQGNGQSNTALFENAKYENFEQQEGREIFSEEHLAGSNS